MKNFKQFINESYSNYDKYRVRKKFRYQDTKMADNESKPMSMFTEEPYDFRGYEYVDESDLPTIVNHPSTWEEFISYYALIMPGVIFNYLTRNGAIDFEDNGDLYWEDDYFDDIEDFTKKFKRNLAIADKKFNTINFDSDFISADVNELDIQIEDLNDELDEIENESNNLYNEQNREAGRLGDKWTDKHANYYGKQLNVLNSKKEKILKKISKLEDMYDDGPNLTKLNDILKYFGKSFREFKTEIDDILSNMDKEPQDYYDEYYDI